MPYITENRRYVVRIGLHHLESDMKDLNRDETGPIVAGDLNYIAFSLALEYIKLKGKSYNNISDAIKALTGAAHEIERRVLDPYEDKVILKNGDIDDV